MPCVSMRRSTRVLVVKGGDGARVLRSGRRLCPDSGSVRLQVIQDCKGNAWFEHNSNREISVMENDSEPEVDNWSNLTRNEIQIEGAMWGHVYKKRKRMNEDGTYYDSQTWEWNRSYEDRMFGKRFVRRQRRRITRRGRFGLAIKVDSYCCHLTLFVRFLSSILEYAMRVKVRLSHLTGFLTEGDISEIFASRGIHFSRDLQCSHPGFCKFFGVVHSVPLFSLDFCAVPSYFLHMQVNMLLRSRFLASISLIYLTEKGRGSNTNIYESTPLIQPTSLALWSAAQNGYRRNGLNSPSFQTKRRSRRPTRLRNSSSVVLHKFNGNLVSNFSRTKISHGPSLVSDRQLRSSCYQSSLPNIKELKSTLLRVREDIESTCCSGNILISESDRCHRKEGVKIMMEFSVSKQWILAVKIDGLLRYSHVAQEAMKPIATNRFTHAMIWTSEDGWKLEFSDRIEWLLFKELYRECCHRNEHPAIKMIPVPGVWEVSKYEDSNSASFFRPNSYIVSNNDEVSRAMGRRAANYDIDSEDEEWINNFNSDPHVENEVHESISEETFELMVDAFEKAQFCSPDDYSDEKESINLCLDLGTREIVEAVYRYWIEKRKQKRSVLVRIFQLYQPKKPQLNSKSILRKRRSFKRQTGQLGRGKQPSVMQAIAAQHDALEEQNAMIRVEEAKISAERWFEIAVQKRKRAQVLMENADLAIYRATMALRFVEAAQVGTSKDNHAAFFDD